MDRTIFEEEHNMFRDSVRKFVEQELVPHHEQWEKDGKVSRDVWLRAGENGFLCMSVPEEYGGLGITDFRYNAIVGEELTRAGCTGPGFTLQNDITCGYLVKISLRFSMCPIDTMVFVMVVPIFSPSCGRTRTMTGAAREISASPARLPPLPSALIAKGLSGLSYINANPASVP